MLYRTQQEVFDAALRGLSSQGFVRSVAGGVCAYRGSDGLKCSIGHLIPDEAYDPAIEGFGIHLLTDKKSGEFYRAIWNLFDDDLLAWGILPLLQAAHDSADTPIEMIRRLRQVALDTGLRYPDEWDARVREGA